MSRRRKAFTLAEIILAIGLTVVAVLSAIALGISAMQSNQKSSDLMLASTLATQTTESFVYGLPGVTDPFWSTVQTGIYQTSSVQLGNSTFEQDLFLQDLSSTQAGLKMVLVNVSWGSGATGRTGYGQQSVQVSRLIYGH